MNENKTPPNHLVGAFTNTEQMSADDYRSEELAQMNTMQSLKTINDYFRQNAGFRTERGDKTTNIINLGTHATYCIPDAEMPKFFHLLEVARRDGVIMHYQEKQQESASGIMIDFDRYQLNNLREIKPIMFNRIAAGVLRLLNEFLGLAAISGTFTARAFFITKPAVVADTKQFYVDRANEKNVNVKHVYKDGFHMLIPEIMIHRDLKKYLISEIKKRGLVDKWMAGAENAIQTGNEMLDSNSGYVNVHFVGHSKVERPAYVLTHSVAVSIDSDGQTDVEKIEVGDVNLSYELSLSWYFAAFREISGNAVVKDIPTWLVKKKYDPLPEFASIIRIFNERAAPAIIPEINLKEIDDSVALLKINDVEAVLMHRLLEILDISYATDYNKWRDVIFALANCSTAYKPLGIWFSQRCPGQWNADSFDNLWETASCRRDGPMLTKRSIFYWASQSNPVQFKEIVQNSYKQVLERFAYNYAGKIEQGMVAIVLQHIFADKFIVDIPPGSLRETHVWWEFVVESDQHRNGEIYKWRREPTFDTITKYLLEQMPIIFGQIEQKIVERREQVVGEKVKYWVAVEKNMKASKRKLFDSGFQHGAIKQAAILFRRRGFAEKLDDYDDVFGVGNGILKLLPEPKLIRSFHEYAISKYTSVPYFPYDPNNPAIQLIEKAFDDSFVEPDARFFWKIYFSQFVDPREVEAVFGMLVGGGSNGKSFWAEVISNTLEEMYSAKMPISLLTSPREQPGATNTALMQAAGKFFIYFSEPNGPETLNSGRMKEMFSGEKQTGNDKYEKQRSFRMRASPLVVSNYDFSNDSIDHGYWRRIYYYRVKVKYCTNPDPNNRFEKKKDPRFINVYKNDPEIKKAMLSFMVHYNQIFRNKYGGVMEDVPCDTVRGETNEYRNRQDTLNRFITQMIVKLAPSDQKKAQGQRGVSSATDISISDLSRAYVRWFDNNVKKMKDANIETINTQFENSYLSKFLVRAQDTTMYLTGHRVREMGDELKPGESFIGLYTKVAEQRDGISADLRDDENENVATIDNAPQDNIAEFMDSL